MLNIDEFKKKITRFYFSIGGYFSGDDSIEIIKYNTQIKSICNEEENIFTNEKWNEFIDKILNENILNWKEKYHNNNILDGEQWELEIEFNDLSLFESCGSNEYPSNWQNFINIINEYFPHLELNYYDIDEEEDDDDEEEDVEEK